MRNFKKTAIRMHLAGFGQQPNSQSSQSSSNAPSTTTTLFDARRELAADLQRREAKRAQARAEAADTEGEASVLAALQAVHRLLRDAGEKEGRERESLGESERRTRFFDFASHLSPGAIRIRKRRSRPF